MLGVNITGGWVYTHAGIVSCWNDIVWEGVNMLHPHSHHIHTVTRTCEGTQSHALSTTNHTHQSHTQCHMLHVTYWYTSLHRLLRNLGRMVLTFCFWNGNRKIGFACFCFGCTEIKELTRDRIYILPIGLQMCGDSISLIFFPCHNLFTS